MTPDLTYLALAALLNAVLWIPYFSGMTITHGLPTPEVYKDPRPRPAPLWVERANRAHINNVQVFAPFAALVLVAHAGGEASAMTTVWCMVFFWSRLAHAAVHLLGIAYLRTVFFLIGFAAIVGLFYEVTT